MQWRMTLEIRALRRSGSAALAAGGSALALIRPVPSGLDSKQGKDEYERARLVLLPDYRLGLRGVWG